MHNEHPVDELPEYARETSEDPGAIERHLIECESCRVELEILRALEGSGPAPLSDLERKRVYGEFEARRVPGFGRKAGRRWLAATWRIAATIALLLTSVGVWQVLESGGAASDWSPELALKGWSEDLADLDIGPRDVRLAFGAGLVEEVQWDDLEGVDPYDVYGPWEEN